MIEQDSESNEWKHGGLSEGHCSRPLPKRLQELLKAGNDNPQIFVDLASCIEEETIGDMLIGAEVNYECLEPLQASLGVSKFDAFLVKRIINDTDEVITEEELTAEFSDPKAMKEYNKLINYGVSFEDSLAGFFVKIIFLLAGLA